MPDYFNKKTQILYINPPAEIAETLSANSHVVIVQEQSIDKDRELAVFPLNSYRGSIPLFFCTSDSAILQGAFDLEHASNNDLIRIKHQIKSDEDVACEIY